MSILRVAFVLGSGLYAGVLGFYAPALFNAPARSSIRPNPLVNAQNGVASNGAESKASAEAAADKPPERKAEVPPPPPPLAKPVNERELALLEQAYSTYRSTAARAAPAKTDVVTAALNGKRPDDLLTELRQAAAANPRSAGPDIAVAEVLGDLRRYGDALAEYGQAIARDPRSPDGYLARGKFLLAIRMPREARMDFALAHAINPTPLTTLLAGPGLDEVATAEAKARTPAELEALARTLRTAIERSPDDGFAHFLLGTAYAAQRKDEGAAAEWQMAARLDPRLGPVRK